VIRGISDSTSGGLGEIEEITVLDLAPRGDTDTSTVSSSLGDPYVDADLTTLRTLDGLIPGVAVEGLPEP
jgi:hypothetical protein